MPNKILAQALLLVALTSGTAHAQWFPYPYPYPGPGIGYPAGYYPGHNAASVRTQVMPRDAQVFVDGYSAGVVDDFDGVFQRLQLVPGHHEIVLYLPGYRTYREHVYLNPGSSHNIRHTMVQHMAGETDEAAPVPLVPPMAGPGPLRGPTGQPALEASRYGTLALRLQPGDATVIIDGEQWRGPQQQDRLAVQLGEGRHLLQVEKAGFQTFAGDVDIRSGETTSLNISLIGP